MKCVDVENAILEGMRDWLAAYKTQIESGKPVNTDQTDTTLDAVIGQLAQLQAQQNNLCDYLEKGVYTVEMFTRRNAAIQMIFRSWKKPRLSFYRNKLSRKPSTVQRWKSSRPRRVFWTTTTF